MGESGAFYGSPKEDSYGGGGGGAIGGVARTAGCEGVPRAWTAEAPASGKQPSSSTAAPTAAPTAGPTAAPTAAPPPPPHQSSRKSDGGSGGGGGDDARDGSSQQDSNNDAAEAGSSGRWASSPPRDSSSLLLARARAGVGFSNQAGVNLMSVDDLFGSSDEDAASPKASGGKGEGGKADSSRDDDEARPPWEAASGGSGGEARSHRAEHANVRERDARLHWPPRASDYRLDASEILDEEKRTFERARRKRLQRGGDAPDASRLFESELEDQLTNLVVMMTLEKMSTGH